MSKFTRRLQQGAPVPMRWVIPEPHIDAGYYWFTPPQPPCPTAPCVPVGTLRVRTWLREANVFLGTRCLATLASSSWKANSMQRRINRHLGDL